MEVRYLLKLNGRCPLGNCADVGFPMQLAQLIPSYSRRVELFTFVTAFR